jgi:hypothetical protein
VLSWIAESQIVNRGFILQRRQKDAHRWDEIASYRTHIELVARDGDSEANEYTYVDRAVHLGLPCEYRLAVVSHEGQREYLGTAKSQ